MRYDRAVKDINELGKIAKDAQLYQIELEAKKLRSVYTATKDKIQSSIMRYGELPGKKVTTLYNEIDKEIAKLSKKLDTTLKKSVNATAKRGMLDAKKQVKGLAGKLKFGAKIGIESATFNKMWHSATKQLLRDTAGITISERIWDTNRVMLKDLKQYIAQGLVEGQYPSEIANGIRGFLILPDVDMRKKYWKEWFKENPPGKGVYRSAAKNIERLHRTEMGRAYRLGTSKYSEKKSWSNGVQWHRVPGEYECVECEDYALHDEGLGEGVYPANSIPVSHPNCQCYVTVHPAPERTTLETDDDFIPAQSMEDAEMRLREYINYPDPLTQGVNRAPLSVINSQIRAFEQMGKNYKFQLGKIDYQPGAMGTGPTGSYSYLVGHGKTPGDIQFNSNLIFDPASVLKEASEKFIQNKDAAIFVTELNKKTATTVAEKLKYQNSLEKLNKTVRHWNVGDDAVHGVTVHETNHAIYIQNGLADSWKKAISEIPETKWSEVSHYGSANIHELFAETGTAIVNKIKIPQEFIDAYETVIKGALK